MPLCLVFLFFCFFVFQCEVEFFFNYSFFEYTGVFVDGLLSKFTSFLGLGGYATLKQEVSFYKLNTRLSYDYNFRTYFNQTYLHAAFNDYMKPYKNLTRSGKLFGDYNYRTRGKKKHARAAYAKQVFTLLYSHTLDCYGVSVNGSKAPLALLYFKRQHLYSVTEMAWAALYLGLIYILSLMHVRNLEESFLPLRETEEVDEEYSQSA